MGPDYGSNISIACYARISPEDMYQETDLLNTWRRNSHGLLYRPVFTFCKCKEKDGVMSTPYRIVGEILNVGCTSTGRDLVLYLIANSLFQAK
jgi:hypothetical protein